MGPHPSLRIRICVFTRPPSECTRIIVWEALTYGLSIFRLHQLSDDRLQENCPQCRIQSSVVQCIWQLSCLFHLLSFGTGFSVFVFNDTGTFFLRFIHFWLCWVFTAGGLSLVAVSGGASLAVVHRLLSWLSTDSRRTGFRSRGTQAQLPRGIKPMSPELAGGFLTTGPSGKPDTGTFQSMWASYFSEWSVLTFSSQLDSGYIFWGNRQMMFILQNPSPGESWMAGDWNHLEASVTHLWCLGWGDLRVGSSGSVEQRTCTRASSCILSFLVECGSLGAPSKDFSQQGRDQRAFCDLASETTEHHWVCAVDRLSGEPAQAQGEGTWTPLVVGKSVKGFVAMF